jgi:hypothetical protein
MQDPADPGTSGRRWRLAVSAAIAFYLFLGISLILRRPGLQYDEALLVSGAVHMLNSPAEFTLPHDPDTWTCVAGRCFPLMTVRYVGAAKEYLYLPLAAAFDSRVAMLRLLSLMLSAIGIWGVARIVSSQVSGRAGAAAAWLLGICPAFLTLNVFDNGAVSMMFAALGLFLLAVSGYLREPCVPPAFLVGAAAGLGVWSRANFVWILAAFGAACLVAGGRKLAARPKHWLAAALGTVAGALPFLTYQVKSRGGTWEAVGMFQAPGGWGERLSVRWVQFSEILLADREHRAMWNGPDTPAWQAWLFPVIVLLAGAVCVFARGAPLRGRGRAIAAMFLALAALLFTSRMAVSEHHLIVLVPAAAAMAAAAVEILCARFVWFWLPAALAGILYAGAALNWHRLTLEGLERTGGVAVWSDGIYALAARLDGPPASKQVKILDWGLQNNLHVLTRGRLKTREIFGGATAESSGSGRSWREEIGDGGVFVLFAPANRQFPAASQAFHEGLKTMGLKPKRTLIHEKSGAVFAEVYEIEPGAARASTAGNSALPAVSRIAMGDPRAAAYIDGFHQIEEGAWRWTRQKFAVTVGAPRGAGGGRLVLKLFVPAAVLSRLGPVTLRARVEGADLAPETYSASGTFYYTRDLNGAGDGRPVRIEFALDKALGPTAAEGRDLGIIVHSAELQAR